MEKTIDRIKKIADYEGITLTMMERIIGASKGVLTRAASKGTHIQLRWLEAIATNFPVWNPEWIITGNGEPSGIKDVRVEWVESETPGLKVETRPRIPIDASAGFLSGIAEGVKPYECEQVPIIPGVPDYTCTIVVRGDSMTPKYESGDELALVPLRDVKSIQWGHAYILDTRDGVLLKRLYDNKDSIRCVSYNPEYPDSFVDKSSVNSIWRIVALLRRF